MVGSFDRPILRFHGRLQAKLQGDVQPLECIQKICAAGFETALQRELGIYAGCLDAVQNLNGTCLIGVEDRI
ncbi:hypothetical protein D3C86_1909970 [compost metagenome]